MKMTVEYSTDNAIAFFNGIKFRKDVKTGYYLATKKTDGQRRERLHCYVWRINNGDIPEGFHVHHIDGDKSNNDVRNLRLIDGKKHVQYHARKYAAQNHDKIRQNLLENAAPKAAAWHGSEAGRLWHSEHAKQTTKNLGKVEYICANCGKHFYAKPIGLNKFCSNTCKTKARYKSGVDNEERICAVCGGKFIANKYASKKCCSKECAIKLRQNKKHCKERQRTSL